MVHAPYHGRNLGGNKRRWGMTLQYFSTQKEFFGNELMGRKGPNKKNRNIYNTLLFVV